MTAKKSIFWSLLSRGATYFLIVLQGMVIARMIGPEGKGIQAKLMASASFFVFFLDFGISNSINYFFSQNKISLNLTKKILQAVCLAQFIFSLFVFLSLLYPPLKQFFLPDQHTDLFLIIYISTITFLETTRLSLNSFLTALLKFKVINWIEIFHSVFRLFCYACLFYFNPKDSILYTVLMIDMIGNALVFAGLVAYILRLPLQIDPQNGDLKPFTAHSMTYPLFLNILSYAFPLFLSNIVIYLNSRLDYIAIEKMMGLKNLGYYAVAASGAQFLTIVPVIIGSVIFSYLNKLAHHEKVELFAFYSRINFSLLLLISALSIVFAPIIIPILFGPQFNNSIFMFQLLIVIALMQSYKYLLGIFLQSINKNKLRLQSDLTALVMNIFFLYPLLRYFGIPGAIGLLFLGQLASILFIHKHLSSASIKHLQFFFIRRAEVRNLFKIDNISKLIG